MRQFSFLHFETLCVLTSKLRWGFLLFLLISSIASQILLLSPNFPILVIPWILFWIFFFFLLFTLLIYSAWFHIKFQCFSHRHHYHIQLHTQQILLFLLSPATHVSKKLLNIFTHIKQKHKELDISKDLSHLLKHLPATQGQTWILKV